MQPGADLLSTGPAFVEQARERLRGSGNSHVAKVAHCLRRSQGATWSSDDAACATSSLDGWSVVMHRDPPLESLADRAWWAFHSLPRDRLGRPPAATALEQAHGLSRGTLGKIFSGSRKTAEASTLARMAKALNVTADWLASGIGSTPRPTGFVPPRPGADPTSIRGEPGAWVARPFMTTIKHLMRAFGARGDTLERVAERSGIAPMRLEELQRHPEKGTVEEYEALARSLGTSFEALVQGMQMRSTHVGVDGQTYDEVAVVYADHLPDPAAAGAFAKYPSLGRAIDYLQARGEVTDGVVRSVLWTCLFEGDQNQPDPGFEIWLRVLEEVERQRRRGHKGQVDVRLPP